MSTFMEHIHREPDSPHTWADGFGTWHVRVPNTPHRHEMTAYQAIRAELQTRAPRDTEIPAFGLAIVEETDTTITYREDWPDEEDHR